jgi:hypothetical protein
MRLSVLVLLVISSSALVGGEIVVKRVEGEVQVRQGVTEVWNSVAQGDVLRPDDTMKTGPRGSALLLFPAAVTGTTAKRIALPPEVIVDISDIRQLSQEELMLKLAMEKVRSSSYQWKSDDLQIPNASVVHGENKDENSPLPENDLATGILQMNGTRVLFENGFYPTCVLKALEVFRLYPTLGEQVENRLLVAEALERSRLKGEALNEYGALLKMPGLSDTLAQEIKSKMSHLR